MQEERGEAEEEMMAMPKAAAAASGKDACRWLRERRVGELAKRQRRLVEVPHTATLRDTVNALVANGVTAAPVAAPPGRWIGAGGSMVVELDRAAGAPRKHYIGMVTMLDVLIHIAEEEWEDDATGGGASPRGGGSGDGGGGGGPGAAHGGAGVVGDRAFPGGSQPADIEPQHQRKGRKLVGTFSATDLRGCPIDLLHSWLPLSVVEFIEKASMHCNTTTALATDKPRTLITCYSETSLAQVMEEAMGGRVHRVWVVDRQGLLVGLVSLSDMLRATRELLLSAERES